MAFDFSNKDPRDPTGVATITRYASKGFLPSGENDWSDFTTDPAAATQRKLTRTVDVALVTLNNGDQFFAVQDANGKPIDIVGEKTGTDADQVRIFNTQTAQAQRQQDQGERRVTSTYPSQYPEGHPQAGQPAMRTDYESGPSKYDPMPRGEAVPPNAVPRVEGTPLPDGTFDNTKPIMVWRTPPEPGYPAGKQVDAKPLDANQRTQWEREQGTAKPATQQAAVPGYPGWVMQETKDATGNSVTVYFPPNSQTPQASLPEKAGEPKAPSFQTVPGGDGQTYIRSISIGPNGAPIITNFGPDGKAVATIPGEKEKPAVHQQQGSDGQTYTSVTTIDANNVPTTRTYSPTGQVVPVVPGAAKPEPDKYTTIRTDPTTGESMGLTRGANPHWEVIPVAGQGTKPTTRAPSLPQIIVGQSQDALREAYDGIQAEVDAGRRTAAWGENRRKEVFETAQLAVNEAHLHEQSRQFNQSQAFNIANARMGNQQGVLEFAVRTALSINGKIKKGSSAGAELFRNLFMLGMQLQQQSGINDIKPGGGQSSVGNTPGQQGRTGAPGQPNQAGNPATRPPIDPGDTQAHTVSADQAAANIAAGLESNGQPRERTPASATTGGGPPLPMPAATGQPSVPAAQPPAASPPAARPVPSQAPPPPPITNPLQAPGPGPKLRVQDEFGNDYELTQQQIDNRPPSTSPLTVLGPVAPAPPPGTTDPGFNRPDMQHATPTDPGFHPPGTQGPDTTDPEFTRPPQAMMPSPFAAMEQFRVPQVDPMQGAGMPAALTRTQVVATPPWLLPPDRLADLVSQYGEDTVMNWPGRELLGVG